MPVDVNLPQEGMLYQREQYAKGGVGVRYWDFRDRQILRHVRGSVIADLGCGEGITLEKLAAAHPGRTVFGLDAEAENVAICRRHGLPVHRGSIYALPYAAASLDCVVFSEVIEHLDEPGAALAEIGRVLKPGGRVIVVFPNDLAFKLARILTGKLREAFYDAGHVMQWTPGKIRRALAAVGLRMVARQNLPFFLWPISLHHLVVAEKE